MSASSILKVLWRTYVMIVITIFICWWTYSCLLNNCLGFSQSKADSTATIAIGNMVPNLIHYMVTEQSKVFITSTTLSQSGGKENLEEHKQDTEIIQIDHPDLV